MSAAPAAPPAADIPHLGRRLSRWLALQTMLGLGLVCAAVYGVASMTLEQHQHETLDLKQQVQEGQTVPLTLIIEGKDGKRESVQVEAPVRPLATKAAPSGHDHKH